MSIVVAILMFSLLVIIHEFGHFIFAIRGGITVEEFSLGMGPKLFGKEVKGVLFSVRALPLGGFCKMLGEDEVVEDENSFSSKSIWTRFKVIFGGPLFNFILAFVAVVIYMFMVSGTYNTTIDFVADDSAAQEVGMQIGDEIFRINGHRIISFNEISIFLQETKGEEMDIVIKRDGEKVTYTVAPKPVTYEDGTVVYMLGINPGIVDLSNILEVLEASVKEMIYYIRVVYFSIGMIFSGNVSADEVAGPVGLVTAVSDTYNDSLAVSVKVMVVTMLKFIGLLSTNLGVMNLLPIPALDGGRLVFIGYELIRRKPIDQEKEGMIHFVGFVLLMGLMVVVFYNDIRKLF